MKKIFLMAAAAVLVFASCSKEGGEGVNAPMSKLSIKLPGATTRAIEAPGTDAAGTITLDVSKSYIFVLNATGKVVHSEALTSAATTAPGQVLSSDVPSDSRVYVIGNIPSADFATVSALTTFSAIQSATSLITTQTDYKGVALANNDGQPKAITNNGDGTANVTISLSPLVSRLELVAVKGGANTDGDAISAFTVTGVYIDDYYPSFTYSGGNFGTEFNQGISTTFNGTGDSGSWAAAGTPLVASFANGDVWAYNVASGGVVRLLIRLENVKYIPNGGEEVDLSGTTYYLTVTGYNGVSAFQRGKIYRIGADKNAFTFTPDDIKLTPNPEDVTLTLNVNIIEWEIVYPEAQL